MSISFFWLERGGRWGLSPWTSMANYQKLNVIQKQAFHFFGWRGVADGVWVHWPTCPIIRSWTKSKNEHFIILAEEVWHMGFKSIDQPGRPSYVKHNPKMSISCFWLERGGKWGLSPSTSPANHQKLNIIQKWAFHFFCLERGGRWGLSPSTSLANHQKLNVIQKQVFHFFGWRRVVDGVWVHRPAWPIIRSWT